MSPKCVSKFVYAKFRQSSATHRRGCQCKPREDRFHADIHQTVHWNTNSIPENEILRRVADSASTGARRRTYNWHPRRKCSLEYPLLVTKLTEHLLSTASPSVSSHNRKQLRTSPLLAGPDWTSRASRSNQPDTWSSNASSSSYPWALPTSSRFGVATTLSRSNEGLHWLMKSKRSASFVIPCPSVVSLTSCPSEVLGPSPKLLFSSL